MKLIGISLGLVLLAMTSVRLAAESTDHKFSVKPHQPGDKSLGADTVDRIEWSDSLGKPRSVDLVTKSDRYNTGWLSQYVYDDPAITCRAMDDGVGGVSDISHMEVGAGGTKWRPQKGDEDQAASAPKLTWIFKGDNHGIVRAEYDLHYIKDKKPSAKPFHIVRDLFFTAGTDNFGYAITMDFSGVPKNDCSVDTRSPYVKWGFTGEPMGPYTGFRSGTDSTLTCLDTQAKDAKLIKTIGDNIIPYNVIWDGPKDRVCAIIGTRPYAELPQGSEYWTGSSEPIVPAGSYDRDKLEAWKLPYQVGAYSGWLNKLTWQTHFQLGYEEVKFGKDYKVKAWPKYSYGVMILLDHLSAKQHDRLIKEGEGIQSVKLTASVGMVAVSGPAGPGREKEKADLKIQGYDPIYRVWRAACVKNKLHLSMDLGATTLFHPVFIVERYSKTKAPALSLNGKALKNGTEFLASLDKKNSRLYLTLLDTLKDKVEVTF